MEKATNDEKKQTRARKRKVDPGTQEEQIEPVKRSGGRRAAVAHPPEIQEEREDTEKRWYVIHTYSGYEAKVKRNLEHRIQSMDMQDKIFQVIVPTEEEIEVKDGQRKTVHKKVFPGYVLVEMKLTNDSWYVVRNTPGVTGFVGSGTKPTPLSEDEVNAIIKQMRAEAPRVKVGFQKGQTVRIIDGPFAEFMGTVDEINQEKGKVKVRISLFGRETPVELDFLQVEKL
ncbi:MAG: transcription termination/antitermination protein NusG [Chloroflexota bacterium]|nr:MAG: transcription termination/antitermination protein NusG [Chloroflexota bacterium]